MSSPQISTNQKIRIRKMIEKTHWCQKNQELSAAVVKLHWIPLLFIAARILALPYILRSCQLINLQHRLHRALDKDQPHAS